MSLFSLTFSLTRYTDTLKETKKFCKTSILEWYNLHLYKNIWLWQFGKVWSILSFEEWKIGQIFLCLYNKQSFTALQFKVVAFFSQTNPQVRNNEKLTFGSHCCSDFRLWGVMNSTFGCWKEGGGISINGVIFWFFNYKIPTIYFPFGWPQFGCMILLLFLYYGKVYLSHKSRPGIKHTDNWCITTMHSLLVGALHRSAIPLFNL